jgi:hypothetical protein
MKRRLVPPVMSAASVFLLSVGAGRSTPMRSGSEAVMVPAEGWCSDISGGESAGRTAVPEAGLGYLELELSRGSLKLARR